jgi:hypothetical protein
MGPRHTTTVARSEDVVQLICAKGKVSISAECVPGTIFSGETYLTASSDPVNDAFVNSCRGRKKSASTKESDKHHEKDLCSITRTFPDTGNSRTVAGRADRCRAGGQLRPNHNEKAREKEQEGHQQDRGCHTGDTGNSGYPSEVIELIPRHSGTGNDTLTQRIIACFCLWRDYH